jgi:predicted secreted protein
MRDEYEDVFRGLVNSLPLKPGVDNALLTLTLLSALNYVPVWYHKGSDNPDTVADQIVLRIVHSEGDAQHK